MMRVIVGVMVEARRIAQACAWQSDGFAYTAPAEVSCEPAAPDRD